MEKEKEERRERVRRRRKIAAVTTSGRVYLVHMTRVCQHCQALIFPSEPLNCCCNVKISLLLLGDYPSPLKDLFTTSKSSNFQDIRQYNSAFSFASFKLICPLVHHGIISYIIHQVPLCGRYLL